MLALPETLDLKVAPDCARQLVATIREGVDNPVIVEAGALTHFDSSVLAVLLACRREAVGQHREFFLRGAPAKLLRLADLYGVRALLGVEPDGH
jgi:phospholipid transport system transporter-binding protein